MVVDVLGLGESLALYRRSANTTIGVNDIASRQSVDFLVLADPPNRFTPDRLRTITGSTCLAVVSHYKEWNTMVRNFKLIKLARRSSLLELHKHDGAFPYSNNSPFIACVLAYRLGARRINMYGVDLAGHPSLGRDTMLARAKKDYAALYAALRERGVILCAARGSALNDTLPLAV